MTLILRLGIVAVLSMVSTGCGSSAEAPATSPQGSANAASGSPEEKCIASANVRPVAKAGRPDSIKASHILVKHDGSKNPKTGVSRTRGQACLRAAEARDKILANTTTFDQAVGAYSDEDGAATRAGSLGDITRSQVDPAFADTAFDLDRGQMSDIVETPFGFHLILRTE